MARNDSWQESLNQGHFNKCSVWAFDDSGDFYQPIEISDSLPTDLGPLLIRAELVTPGGVALNGYIVFDFGVYAIGIFLQDREFIFNLNTPGLNREDLRNLRLLLESEDDFVVFPLAYTTEHSTEDGVRLAGTFTAPVE